MIVFVSVAGGVLGVLVIVWLISIPFQRKKKREQARRNKTQLRMMNGIYDKEKE